MNLLVVIERRREGRPICRLFSWPWLSATALLTVCVASTLQAADWTARTSQYAHTAWRVQDGFFGGIPSSIVQTTDGYLWLGTSAGLLRFDGVRFVPWAAPSRSAALRGIDALEATADGSLWVAAGGLRRLRDGELTAYSTLGGHVTAIVADQDGGVWFARTRVRDSQGPLCHARDSEVHCFGRNDGVSLDAGGPIFRDTHGDVWLGGDSGIATGKPGSFRTFTLPAFKGLDGFGAAGAFADGPDGTTLVGLSISGPEGGLRQFEENRWVPFIRPGLDGRNLQITSMLKAKDGSLWIGTVDAGLYVVHGQSVDHFSASDGLSGDDVNMIFQDRERNMWVVTSGGIDRFRLPQVLTFSRREGLSADNASSVVAARDGTVYAGNHNAIDQIRDGSISSIRATQGLPGRIVTTLLEDHTGRLWAGVEDKLTVREGAHFRVLARGDGKPVGALQDLIEDTAGDLWGLPAPAGPRLIHVHGLTVREELVAPDGTAIRSIAAHPAGGLVVTFPDGRISRYTHGLLSPVVSTNVPHLHRLSMTADGHLLALSPYGFVGLQNWKLQRLGLANGLPCDSIFSFIQDREGGLWLYASCGLIALNREEFERWWKDPATQVKYRLFDNFDGVQASEADNSPAASEGPDGRLWFVNNDTIQMFDPRSVAGNAIAPPVHIEAVIADRKNYALQPSLRLPRLTRDLEIDYTALSLTVPQKVQFRYRLEGRDKDWQDPINRRQAFYTDLLPGHYTFHVIASNNDGVWNTVGDSLSFFIPPAFYQTAWFKLLLALAVVAFLRVMYVLRLRRATTELGARLGERLQERERIARELHDTLLQDFQAVVLRFQLVANRLVQGDPRRAEVEDGLEYADKVLAEGREHIRDIRADTRAHEGLVKSLAAYGQDLSLLWPLHFAITAIGEPFELYPVVSDEMYRIGREAMGNAFRHSKGSLVKVEVSYTKDAFVMRICDDGQGIGADILKDGRPGHWGISSMRERARKIGASLNFTSSPDSGTCLELRIDVELANGLRRSWFQIRRKNSAKDVEHP